MFKELYLAFTLLKDQSSMKLSASVADNVLVLPASYILPLFSSTDKWSKPFVPLCCVPPLRLVSIMRRHLSFINIKKNTFWYPNFKMIESMFVIWCLSWVFFFFYIYKDNTMHCRLHWLGICLVFIRLSGKVLRSISIQEVQYNLPWMRRQFI